LFSEFVHDLPIELPSELKDVPITKDSSEVLIKTLCENIRNRKDLEETYIYQANRISQELSLPQRFKNEPELGKINTFAFEDTTFFFQFKSNLISGNLKEAQMYMERSSLSIWSIYDD